MLRPISASSRQQKGRPGANQDALSFSPQLLYHAKLSWPNSRKTTRRQQRQAQTSGPRRGATCCAPSRQAQNKKGIAAQIRAPFYSPQLSAVVNKRGVLRLFCRATMGMHSPIGFTFVPSRNLQILCELRYNLRIPFINNLLLAK